MTRCRENFFGGVSILGSPSLRCLLHLKLDQLLLLLRGGCAGLAGVRLRTSRQDLAVAGTFGDVAYSHNLGLACRQDDSALAAVGPDGGNDCHLRLGGMRAATALTKLPITAFGCGCFASSGI